MEKSESTLLEVKDLKMYFPIQKGFLRRVVGHVRAVDGVSFFIREGETLGLVGESGCGKTTVGRSILRAYEPTAGQVLFRVKDQMVDILKLKPDELKPLRREMQIIFQDPFSSLNPRMTVMDIISEPLVVNNMAQGDELKSQVRHLLEAVGLRAQHMNRYPYAFSGGQRQRIGIARALALRPKLVVCDEPVSALDVSIQAQTINLLEDLQKEFGLTYLFIANHQFGAQGQGAGDANPLALSATEGIGITIHVLGAQADGFEQVAHLGLEFIALGDVVDHQRLADDVHDGHARVERRKRVLENDLHLAPQRFEFIWFKFQDVNHLIFNAEQHLPGGRFVGA